MSIKTLSQICANVLDRNDLINFLSNKSLVKSYYYLEKLATNYQKIDNPEIDLLVYTIHRIMNYLELSFDLVIKILNAMIADGGVITGSFMLQCVKRQDFSIKNRNSDLDLFIKSDVNLDKCMKDIKIYGEKIVYTNISKYNKLDYLKSVYYYKSKKGRIMNIIIHDGSMTIDNFDLSISKFVFDGRKIYCPENTYQDALKNKISLYEKGIQRETTLSRISKYHSYGYQLDKLIKCDNYNGKLLFDGKYLRATKWPINKENIKGKYKFYYKDLNELRENINIDNVFLIQAWYINIEEILKNIEIVEESNDKIITLSDIGIMI